MTSRPRAYSYIRFSSPEQAKGDSVRRQTEMAARYAAAHGLDLDTELTFADLGVSAFSGRNSTMGALGLFRRAVEDGLVQPGDYLLVESLDRVSRQNPRRALRQLEEIVDAGIRVVTLDDGVVHSKETMDEALGLLAVLFKFIRANEESETKSRRLRAVWGNKRRQARERGTRATRAAPEWLRPDGEGFSIIPERAEVIRRIFRETIEGRGQHFIAEALTAEGVPTWGNGKVWHRTYVRKLLQNPAVIGTAVFHETVRLDGGGRARRPSEEVPNYFPPVIDSETWARVQQQLGARGHGGLARRGRHAGRPIRHLLANLARCPRCDQPMTRVNKGAGNGRAYLVCTIAKAGGGCAYRGVPVEDVDSAIFARVVDLLEHPPATSEREGSLAEELRIARAEKDALLDELRALAEARRARTFTPSLAQRRTELMNALSGVEEREKRLEQELWDASSPLVAARIGRLWDALMAGWAEDLTLANAAMRETFASVVVDYEAGDLHFRWRHGGESTIRYRWFTPEGQAATRQNFARAAE